MLTTQALNAFLTARARLFPAASDLMLRWTPDMETQVNVAADGHEKVDGTRGAYTDGVRKWWNIRIPKHADSSPEWTDYEMTWPLDLHAEAIGSTGWDWKLSRSRWCGFDFDAIAGHAEGVGISAERLEEVRQAATDIPWVEVRKSTGGKGIHFYVYFDEDDLPVTANHTEHAALARAVLSMLSAAAQYDFASQIDACGGNMWLWHRKMSLENGGLSLVKPAKRPLKASELASNWRDHAEVVTRKRSKIRLRALEPHQEKDFETLATSRKFVPLDDRHQKLIEKLGELGHEAIWVGDYHCLQTHTLGLKQISEDADLRAELGLVGYFDTISSGSTSVNCFMFPLPDGAWKVCRFTLGLHEAPSWNQSPAAWTWCYFNAVPDLATAAMAFGGVELESDKGFAFDTLEMASRAAAAMGEDLRLGPDWNDREAILRADSNGRLTLDVKREENDDRPKGFYEKRGKGWWSRIYGLKTAAARADDGQADLVRICMTPSCKPAGMYINTSDRGWVEQEMMLVRPFLAKRGCDKATIESILGDATDKFWKKVSLPFEPEYPGDRQWNYGAPQFRYQPALSRDEKHPNWDRVLNHVGANLTPYLANLAWAKGSNITIGGDYLRCYFAMILREPWCKLPLLYIYGPEKCGKSTIEEAFSQVLITHGVVNANSAITGAFNGELEGAILCVLNEIKLTKFDNVMERLKQYITDKQILIRRLYSDGYTVPNCTHWIYLSNHWNALPAGNGDTRVTVISVDPLPPASQIPWEALKLKLIEEAPAFLRTLLDMPLPVQIDRLRLPVVETQEKEELAAMNRSAVEHFIAETCHDVPGALIPFSDFYTRFLSQLSDTERGQWSKQRLSKELPPTIAKGRHTANELMIGNLSFENVPCVDCRPWVKSGRRLTRIEPLTIAA